MLNRTALDYDEDAMRRLFFTMSVVSIAMQLQVAPTGAEPALDCKNDQTQTALNICSFERFKRADADLNAAYRELLPKLDPKGQGYARVAQAAWIKFRDAECVSRTGGGPDQGGTIWPLIHNECMTELTRLRLDELRMQIKCPGGHLDC